MRVTALELFPVPPPWLLLKLSTDEGISGWGEPIVEGRVATTRAAIEELGELVIGQPDLSHAGGLLETRKIAARAEAFDVAVAPHCPLGPVALAVSLQLDARTPNAVLQELSLRMHYDEGADLLDYIVDDTVFDIADGSVAVPPGPGLGVEIDDERVREAARDARMWHNPVWRNDDGTVAEW